MIYILFYIAYECVRPNIYISILQYCIIYIYIFKHGVDVYPQKSIACTFGQGESYWKSYAIGFEFGRMYINWKVIYYIGRNHTRLCAQSSNFVLCPPAKSYTYIYIINKSRIAYTFSCVYYIPKRNNDKEIISCSLPSFYNNYYIYPLVATK